MDDNRELRNFAVKQIELRAAANAPTQIVGYAAVFNQLSEELWGFREKIAPGAFAGSIATEDVFALWQHQSDKPLARKANRTLGLREDTVGLAVEITPVDTSWGRDAIASVESGLVSHFSFGFETIRDEWDWTDRNMPVRTLLEVKLHEVSPVTFPAYPQTSAEARNKLAEINKRYGESVDALARASASAQARESLLAQVRIAEIEI
jgi:hypothetical protein